MLGGQAVAKGGSGTWKGLTDSVKSLADTLTGQLRTMAEVATAVEHRGAARSGREAEEQLQPGGHEPARDDGAERAAGLAAHEHGPLLGHAAGAPRPEAGHPADHVRAVAARRRAARGLLHGMNR